LSSRLKVSGNDRSDQSKEPSSSNNKHGRGRSKGRGSGGCGSSIGHGGENIGAHGGENAGRSSDGTNMDVAGDECRYCGKKGHWARECQKKKRDAEVHTAQAGEEDEPTLFMASATVIEPIIV
jgi:hypothetical protein